MLVEHSPEYGVFTYIKKMLSDVSDPTFIEIGARKGEDTERLLSVLIGEPDYHLFEPDPYNFNDIMLNDNLSHITKNMAAVSDINGKAEFYTSGGRHPNNGGMMTGAGSLRKPKDVLDRHSWIVFKKGDSVNTLRIDDYCESQGIEMIDFIWADMQGAEYDMLVGAEKMIPKTRFMLLEYSEYELYEGQKKLEDYMELLNKNSSWELVHKFSIDALIQNTSI
jgi:FkbM family methyltransferase